jgi:hypothetical protein
VHDDGKLPWRNSLSSALVTKLGGPWAQWGRVSPRTIFDQKFTDLRMKLFDFGLVDFRSPDLVREHTRPAPSLRCKQRLPSGEQSPAVSMSLPA